MARYIDADMITYQNYIRVDGCLCAEIEPYVTKRWINRMPEEDVAPVVHGKWKTNSDYPDTLICSNCDSKYDVVWIDCGSNYCPHCGAKMEE